MSADEVASAFIQHYYSTLDSNPGALSGLYVSHPPYSRNNMNTHIYIHSNHNQLFLLKEINSWDLRAYARS